MNGSAMISQLELDSKTSASVLEVQDDDLKEMASQLSSFVIVSNTSLPKDKGRPESRPSLPPSVSD